MSLEKAQESIAVPAALCGGYNRIAARPIRATVGRDRGGRAGGRPIREFEPERVFVFKPGASLK